MLSLSLSLSRFGLTGASVLADVANQGSCGFSVGADRQRWFGFRDYFGYVCHSVCHCTLVTASATNVRLTVEVSGSTTTGATFKVANWSPVATAASSLINWVAVGI